MLKKPAKKQDAGSAKAKEPVRASAKGSGFLAQRAGNRATIRLLDESLAAPELADPATAGLVPRRLQPQFHWFPGLAEEAALDAVKADYQVFRPLIDTRSADAYAALVQSTFGSYDAYLAFKPVAEAQLEAPVTKVGRKLRTFVDYGKSPKLQQIFWTWVSWRYRQQGIDPLVTVPRGMTTDMSGRLQKAEKNLGEKIPSEGFNPRPQKDARMRYVLAAKLSEHATGNAVDIEPEGNPKLSAKEWATIQKLTGKGKIDVSAKRWEADPEGVYDDVADLSARWQQFVQARVRDEELSRSRAGALSPGQLVPPAVAGLPLPERSVAPLTVPLELPPVSIGRPDARVLEALADIPDLSPEHKLVSLGGVMRLSRDLVLELRGQGLVWGATFPDPDLHHFQIAAPPLAEWPRVKKDKGG